MKCMVNLNQTILYSIEAMACHFLRLMLFCHTLCCVYAEKKYTIQFEAMTNTEGDSDVSGLGGYIIGAQYLALETINNDSSILKDYKLVLSIHNTKNDNSRALEQAIDISAQPTLKVPNKERTIRVPSLLGAPSSTLSILTNPVLAAFYWSQMSSAATSIQLSEPSYPTFFRTVPADDIQSRTIVWMCTQFNWTKIAILYYGDSYGVYLANSIIELTSKTNIKAHQISFVNQQDSVLNAAQTFLTLDVYIIILIPSISSLELVFNTFNDFNLLQFPYYYIGVDSWFQTERILDTHINNYTKGFVGTVPWQPTALTYSDYEKYGYGEIYNNSFKLWNELSNKWNYALQNDQEFEIILKFLKADLSVEIGDVYAIYGWDSAYTLALALDQYDKMYNLSNILDQSIENVSFKLQNIFKNESFWFLGISGNVSFYDNGNRRDGLYALGNVIDNNGNIEYFGVWADGINTTKHEHNLEYEDCDQCILSKIVWPDEFVKYEIIPRSTKLITYEIIGIPDGVITFIGILCIISMCIVVLTIFLQWKWRDNVIIKAASWKLNVITCIGCLLSDITIIMYGWTPTNIICNLREWLLIISFTLVFMPLFLKTYRISVIFTGMLARKTITDFRLIIGVLVCLFIDTIMLLIFTIIEFEHVVPSNGSIYSIHKLHDVQEQYLYCIKNDQQNDIYNLAFLMSIAGWKSIQLLFGLSVALIVSRISLEYLEKFNETTSQIFAIMFTVLVCVGAAIPILFQQIENPIDYYWILGISGLLITNVVLGANVLPRLWAVYKGKEDKFKSSQQEIFKSAIRNTFQKRNQRSLMNIIHEVELINVHKINQARNIIPETH